MILILLILSILFLLFSTRIPKKKPSVFFAFIIMTVIVAGSVENVDYSNYMIGYANTVASHETEWLYIAMRFFAKDQLGWDYHQFRLALSILGIALLYNAFVTYFKNSNTLIYATLLFMVFPFPWEVVVFRNFIGFCIVFYAFRYLFEFKLSNIIRYVCCILLASGIQFTMVVYLLLLLAPLVQKSKATKWLVTTAAVLAVGVMFFPNLLLSIVGTLTVSLTDNRANIFGRIATRNGYLVLLAIQSLFFFTMKYGRDTGLKYRTVTSLTNNDLVSQGVSIAQIIYAISLIGFFFCPLYRIHGNFTRILINMSLFGYVQLGTLYQIYPYRKDGGKIERGFLAYVCLFIIYIVIISIIVLYRKHWNDIIVPMFGQNWIIEMLLG